jgi:hypothetical protein
MRTRRLHARLAYVKRAENLASVLYAAASTFARTPRPPRVAYAEASCRPRLRGKKTFKGRASHRILGLARNAGSHDAHKAIARTLMRTLGKILRRAFKPCDNHIQRESFRAGSAPTCSVRCHDALRPVDTKEWQQKTRRIAANSARVSDPMHLTCTVKLRSSVLYGQVK